MVQKKVDQSTPHHILYRELDDLKMIINNSFTQLNKSFSRQLEQVKETAEQFNKVATGKGMMAKDPRSSFWQGLPRIAGSMSATSPRAAMEASGIDLNNVEVL